MLVKRDFLHTISQKYVFYPTNRSKNASNEQNEHNALNEFQRSEIGGQLSAIRHKLLAADGNRCLPASSLPSIPAFSLSSPRSRGSRMGIKLLALTGRHSVRRKRSSWRTWRTCGPRSYPNRPLRLKHNESKELLGVLGGFAVQGLILTARCAQDAMNAKKTI